MRKLFTKLNNKHFLAFSGNAVIAFFGLLTSALLYRFLSRSDAGKWFVFLSIISLCDAIRNGFLGTATVKFYAGTDEARGSTVLGSVWFLAITLTAAVLLINAGGLLFLPFLHDDGFILSIKWVGLTFLSALPFSVIYWKLQADEDYGKMLLLKLVNSISTPLAFTLLFCFGKITLENVVIYNFLTNCLTSILGIISGYGRVRTLLKRSKESITELVHFGKHSMGTTLSSTLLSSTDTFVIRIVLGPAAVAIYNVPRQLMQFVEMVLRTFIGTGMSGMAIAFNQKKMLQVAYIMKKYAGMLTVIFIPIVLVSFLLADIAIGAMSGGKYIGTEAANIFRLFMLFSLIAPIERFNGAALDIIHKPKINFYKVILMLMVNITVDVAALAIFKSLYAVAIAGLITTLSGAYFGYYHLRKYINYSIKEILFTGFRETKTFLKQQLKMQHT